METPTDTPPPILLTTTDIADRIAQNRGACNPVSVWRVLQRLGIQPAQSPGRNRIKLYTEADALRVADEMRAPNKNKDTTASK